MEQRIQRVGEIHKRTPSGGMDSVTIQEVEK